MIADMSKFKEAFLVEAEDHLQRLNDNLLKLEKSPADKALLSELMRSSHTLKGSSAAMGYAKTAFLTHVMEDVFDEARNEDLSITPTIVEVLFKTVDGLTATIDTIKTSDQESDVDDLAAQLKQIAGVATEGAEKSKKESIVKAETTPAHDDAVVVQTKTGGTALESIRVPVERLGRMMSLLEELVIDKMKIVELAKNNPTLAPTADHLSRLVSDFQYQVLQMRMVPVEQVFARFPRLVRDTAMKVKKEVDFQISGGDIELDRTILERLAEPLVHLLKNAVDHGVHQSGYVRLSAARKKEFVIISVENDGSEIDFEKVRAVAIQRNIVSAEAARTMDKAGLIDVLFDGRLSTKDEVTEISGRGIGLSAVKQFAEQNGGRVEVVSPIESGVGTRFTLELPLSLAIINILLVEVSSTLFAIPFSAIERSVRIDTSDIKKIGAQDVAIISDTRVPLVYLKNMFFLPADQVHAPDATPIASADSVLAVLLHHNDECIGVVVDDLRAKLEIIVKPLPSALRSIKGFSGSTILGDGSTVLIVDAMSLLEDMRHAVRS